MERKIIQRFRLLGLSLRKDALRMVVEFLQDCEEKEEELTNLSLAISKEYTAGSIVTMEIVEKAFNKSKTHTSDYMEDSIVGYSAFDTPLLHFDKASRSYSLSLNESNYLYSANCRIHSALENLWIIEGRITRNKQFLSSIPEIVSIESLAGVGEMDLNKFVSLVGVLCRNASNLSQFFLEDSSGSILLDLSESSFPSGFFTEGMIVVVVGLVRGNVFHVESISHPPAESRETSLRVLREVEYLGIAHDSEKEKVLLEEEQRTNTMIILLSNVYLDEENTIHRLSKLFSSYETLTPPPFFLFIGDFFSPAFSTESSNLQQVKRLFDSFTTLLQSYPLLVQQARFAFISGCETLVPTRLVPYPAIPSVFTDQLRSLFSENPSHLLFLSNPCRIRFYTQEICIYREEVLEELAKNSIHFQENNDPSASMVKSLLRQGHLVPFTQTILPHSHALDSFLRLFPLPSLLVLCCGGKQFLLEYSQCQVVNPGSFNEGNFVVYRPATKETEFSECVL